MTRYLVLDDQRERHDGFDTMLSGRGEVVHAYLFSEYTKALKTGRFDAVFLDHDLGDAIDQERVAGMYSGDRAYDGRDAAEYLADIPSDRWPETVVIHSWNSHGACAMEAILKQAGMPDVRKAAYGPRMMWWLDEVA